MGTSKTAGLRSQADENWRRIRAIVLARDGMVCQSCGRPCRASETAVHHLIPRTAGGIDHPANLITLCDGAMLRDTRTSKGSLPAA